MDRMKMYFPATKKVFFKQKSGKYTTKTTLKNILVGTENFPDIHSPQGPEKEPNFLEQWKERNRSANNQFWGTQKLMENLCCIFSSKDLTSQSLRKIRWIFCAV